MTSASSKASGYALNRHIQSRLHVILICLAFTGRPEKLYQADHHKTRPGAGFDSVEAVTTIENGAVVYHESVIYQEERIMPVGLVVYTR